MSDARSASWRCSATSRGGLGDRSDLVLPAEILWWSGDFTASVVERLISELIAAALLTGDSAHDDDMIEGALRRILARRCGLEADVTGLDVVRRTRLSACEGAALAGADAERGQLGLFSLRRYAEELGLVRRSDSDVQVRPAGAILFGLRGADAVRWLLALEVTGALGDGDPWRISLRRCVSLGQEPVYTLDVGEEPVWPWDYELRRLAAAGMIHEEEVEEQMVWRCRVTDFGRQSFTELEESSGATLRTLAAAVLADEATEVLRGRLPGRSEVAILARQSRMMAHELRNALVPAKFAVGQLRQAIEAGERAGLEVWDLVVNGLDRALRFAADMARVADVGPTTLGLFAVAVAVRDAVAGVELKSQHPIDLDLRSGVDRIYLAGSRERFVMALINL